MLPRRWVPSATRSSLTSDGATIGFTRARELRPAFAAAARRGHKDRVGGVLHRIPAQSSATSGSAIMARRETSFVCQNCGAAYSRWQGKCDACGEGNTIAEESSGSPQSRMPRTERLGLAGAEFGLAAETSVEDIVATLGERGTPHLVFIDSIQTMWTDLVEAAPGSVTQVRASSFFLMMRRPPRSTLFPYATLFCL